MFKMRFLMIAVVAILAASCAVQADPQQPAPTDAVTVDGAGVLPFQVPEGAQFVARARNASTLYRIQGSCSVLHSLNPETVVFFWTLEAGRRAGFRLSEDEGCK